MKRLLILVFFVVSQFSFAQRSNDKDTTVSYINPVTNEQVVLKLNTEWLDKGTDEDNRDIMTFTSKDKKIQVLVLGTLGGMFKYSIYDLKADTTSVWTVLPEKNIVKGVKATEEDRALLLYGAPVPESAKDGEDTELIGMIVRMPQSYRTEWEAYFDKVSQTLSIKK